MSRHLDLVFLWHMHQPDYRDHQKGEVVLPWTLMHALKDYCDMADHLERHPGMRCVVNFVPVLLEQIEDYQSQFASGVFRDPLLRLLALPSLDDISFEDRDLLMDTCFRSNHHHMLQPFPHYVRLQEIYKQVFEKRPSDEDKSTALHYLSGNYFSDLLTWYLLAWSGETERRREPLLLQLIQKGEHYSAEDRRQLLRWAERVMTSIIPRYRALQERGQIELSATPEAHPLAPLLLDFASVRESVPGAMMPKAPAYPGGRARVMTHITMAQQSHQRRFGVPPTGMWPAEGALSTATVDCFSATDIKWIASGEGVLNNSLAAAGMNAHRAAYRPWRVKLPGAGQVGQAGSAAISSGSSNGDGSESSSAKEGARSCTIFFRDERLSDLIGFEYSDWRSEDAARHFVGELEKILDSAPEGETPIVGVMLDGENAWESYPYNGWYFFEELYTLITNHANIRPTTFAELCREQRPSGELPALVAGSWVFGNLLTWMGDTDKNRAWDLLVGAKTAFDEACAQQKLSSTEIAYAETQLLHCESSDWFWWFGDYNQRDAVEKFDQLYRRTLRNFYALIRCTPPPELDIPLSRGSDGAIDGGAMRRATN